jgi:formamidopyrimidine-DNA glycosylase
VPELAEVEAYRRLAERVVGRRVAEVVAPDPWYLKGGLTAEGARDALRGRRIAGARRRGKLLLLDTDGPVVGLRFGMTGRLLVDGEAGVDRLLYASDRELERWDRFALRFEEGGDLRVRDPRRLGGVVLDPPEARLGPDALTVGPAALARALGLPAQGAARALGLPAQGAARALGLPAQGAARALGSPAQGAARALGSPAQGAARALGTSPVPLKARLLDQTRLAGVGNLAADEALWRAGLDPARPAASLTPAEVRRLHRHLRATLAELLARGGSHTGDLQPERRPGGVCPRDGTPLVRRTVGGRTTWSCPRHQH